MLCKSYSVPWKNTEGLFFYNPLHMKSEETHKLSLEDYLLVLYVLDLFMAFDKDLEGEGEYW